MLSLQKDAACIGHHSGLPATITLYAFEIWKAPNARTAWRFGNDFRKRLDPPTG